ncbi:MAG: WD40 repeat domain-containing protein, partial [Gemmataceae bacterium]|nr:WD40 repeat domain-containing protein [Gemmataceae bacterium]
AVLGDRLVWAVPAADGAAAELVGWDHERAAVGWRLRLDGKAPDRVFSQDGKRAVGLTWDEEAKRWDVAVYDGPAGKTLHAWTMKDIPVWGSPWPVAFTGDGAVLFVGCREGVIGLDVATGREVARVATGVVPDDHLSRRFPLAASADGRRIAVVNSHDAAGGKFRVRVFDVRSGKETAGHDLAVDPEHNGGVWYGVGLRFSPDGRKLAVTAGPGTAVVVCNADSSAAQPRVLDGGLSRPTALAFGPDNATLAVGYEDGTGLVWDLAGR